MSNITDRLENRGGILVDSRFDPTSLGPKTIEVNGRQYYRFMDYMYIPNHPYDLSPEEIDSVCAVRMENFEKVVNISINRAVMLCMTQVVRDRHTRGTLELLRVLDFGCGGGFSSILFQEMLGAKCRIAGVDLSQKAVDLARQNGIDAHFTHVTDGLPFGTAEFDVVLACFVLHFKIQEATFGEIRRVLKPSGVFVFNLFNIDTDIVVDSLEQSGFSVSCSSPNCALKSNHSVWSALPLTPLESS